MTNQMNLTNFKRMLDSPDFSVIQNVYFKISLKAFKECFTNITHSDKYFDNVHKSLLDIAEEEFSESTKEWLEENLTVGTMIWVAETILRKNDKCGFDDETALFIVEKLLVEPLAILGKELHKDNKNNC